MCEKRAGKELTVLLLVEPSTLDIQEPQTGLARKRERIERELRDRLVGARVRFVIKNMNRTIPDLEVCSWKLGKRKAPRVCGAAWGAV